MSKVRAGLHQRLVEADVGRAVGAAAAGDEAERRAVDEAIEPLGIADVVERHVMVHGDVAGRQPARRAGDRPARARAAARGAARRAAAAPRPAAPAHWAARLPPCMPTASTRSACRIAFSDQGVSSGSATNSTIVVLRLERIERPRRLGAVDGDRRGQHGPGHLRPHEHRAVAAPEHPGQSHDEARGQLARAGADERDGARARIGRRRAGDVGVRHAARQRHGQRVPDGGVLRRQLLELGAPQPQHQAVAQCGHGGGAHAAGEEGDLADRLARTQLGDHLAPARDRDGKPPRDDDIKGIRHLALAHQHVAALEVERLQLGGEARALGILEIAEDLDPVEAVLGNLRFHWVLCFERFPSRPYPSLPALRTLRHWIG